MREGKRHAPTNRALLGIFVGFQRQLVRLIIVSLSNVHFTEAQITIRYPAAKLEPDRQGQRFFNERPGFRRILRAEENEQPLVGQRRHERTARWQMTQRNNHPGEK